MAPKRLLYVLDPQHGVVQFPLRNVPSHLCDRTIWPQVMKCGGQQAVSEPNHELQRPRGPRILPIHMSLCKRRPILILGHVPMRSK